MGKSVTFALGPAGAGSHLTGRQLVIRDVSTVPPTTLVTQSLAATIEVVTIELPDNRECEARLIDTSVDGLAGNVSALKFSTGRDDFDSGQISIICIDETSESSGSSSSSTSSLSSSSSSTSSLSSSSSSHSRSSSSSLSSSSTSESSSSRSTSSISSLSSLSSSSTSSVSVSSSSSSSS